MQIFIEFQFGIARGFSLSGFISVLLRKSKSLQCKKEFSIRFKLTIIILFVHLLYYVD